MRILFLCPIFLLPVNNGMRIRLYNLMKILREQGHELGLISAIYDDELELVKELPPWFKDTAFAAIRRPNAPASPGNWLNLKRFFRVAAMLLTGAPRHYALAYKPELAEALDKLIDSYDIVCVELYSMAANISKETFHRHRHKLILVEHDITYIPRERAYKLASGFKRFRLWLTYTRVRRMEILLLKRFAHVVAMSEPDRDIIEGFRPGRPAYVVPNGVDTEQVVFQERQKPNGPPRLLFVGGFDHAPNLDAVTVFIKEYMPLLRQRFPGITFDIAGKCDSYDLEPLKAPDVHFLGFVEDLAPLYQQATAAVAILRFGGGTKLKVLQAMAVGTPIIASNVGVEGIALTPGLNYLTAHTPEETAVAVDLLHHNFDKASDIARQARKLCLERYDWRSIGLHFGGILQQISAGA